jgi:DNA gyrase inhibitor GyrI
MKMKMLTVILIIGVITGVLLVGSYAYYGGFKTIVFTTEEQGGETVVYEEMTGDYSQTPKVSDKIYQSLLNDEKIATTKGIGIYYDDPKVVEKSKLRSDIGCIIEGVDSATVAQLAQKYRVKTLPKTRCLVTEFPYRGMMSVMIGVMRVYPAFEKYCSQNGLPENFVTEIYDVPNKKIIYRREI